MPQVIVFAEIAVADGSVLHFVGDGSGRGKIGGYAVAGLEIDIVDDVIRCSGRNEIGVDVGGVVNEVHLLDRESGKVGVHRPAGGPLVGMGVLAGHGVAISMGDPGRVAMKPRKFKRRR